MVCSWYQPRPRPRFRLAAAIDSLRRPSEIKKKKEHTSFPGNTSMYGLIMALIVILCFAVKYTMQCIKYNFNHGNKYIV